MENINKGRKFIGKARKWLPYNLH